MTPTDRQRAVLTAFRQLRNGEGTADELAMTPTLHGRGYHRRAVYGMLAQLDREGLVEHRLAFGSVLWRPTDAGAAALG